MATYNHLPVYKKTYDLLLQLFRLSQNMERDYRYTIGENLKKEVIEMMMSVYRILAAQPNQKNTRFIFPRRESGRAISFSREYRLNSVRHRATGKEEKSVLTQKRFSFSCPRRAIATTTTARSTMQARTATIGAVR